MKSKLKAAWRFIKWLGLAGLLYYLALADGWKDITYGRFIRQGVTMFSETANITEVRISLLQGEAGQQPAGTFPLHIDGERQGVYGEVRLTGDQLKEFLGHWRALTPHYGGGAMCHDPVYGFRFYKGLFVTKQTTMCWHCSNFCVDAGLLGTGCFGFDSKSKEGQELLIHCNKLLPFTHKPLEPEPTALQDFATPLQPKAGEEPSPISRTARLVARDGKHFLAFHLTNISGQPLETYPCMLPWGESSHLGLAVVNSYGHTMSSPYPIADPPFEQKMIISPAQSLDGEREFPPAWDSLTNARFSTRVEGQDFILIWSYRMPSGADKPYAPCTGVIAVPFPPEGKLESTRHKP